MREVAHGEVKIEVNDREALAKLATIDKQFERTMDSIDRESAEVSIGADLRELRQDLKEAKARLKAFREEEKRNDSKQNRLASANAEKLVQGIDKRINAQTRELNVQKRANAASAQRAKTEGALERAQQHRIATGERAEAKRARAEAIATRSAERAEKARQAAAQKADRDRLAAINREARVSSSLRRQQQREASAAEKAALSAQKLQERAQAVQARQWATQQRAAEKRNQQHQREQAELPKLEAQYAKLVKRSEELDHALSHAGTDRRAKFFIDIDRRDVARQLGDLERTIRARSGHGVTIPVRFERSQNIGRRLNEAIGVARLGGGPVATAGALLGRSLTRETLTSIRRGLSPGVVTRAVGSGLVAGMESVVGSVASGAQRLASGLSNMTLRLGPFTATIRQFMVVMALLGPSIVDLIGSVGALGGSLQGAIVGSGGLAAAALVGFGQAALGVGMILRPLIKDLGSSKKAYVAYHDAVLKHGRGSDEANKKLKEFQNTLKGISPTARAGVRDFFSLQSAWHRMTADRTRPVFFETLGALGRAAHTIMPQFADQSVRAFQIAGNAVQDWAKRLSSVRGRNVLDATFRNANTALGPLLHGLGSFAAWIGKVGASFSRYLAPVASVFDRWATRLSLAANNTTVLDAKTDRFMQSLKSVGNFLTSAGRLLFTFFNSGANAGDRLVDTMTNAMNRWTAMMQTPAGAANMQSFFQRSVTGVQALYNALGPLIGMFVQWAGQMAPFASAFFNGIGYVGRFVSSLMQMSALRGPITALATTLGTMWAVGRIASAVGMVRSFMTALLGVVTGETAAAAAVSRNTAALNLNAAAAVRAGTANRAAATASMAGWAPAGRAASTAGGAARGAGAAAAASGAQAAAAGSRWGIFKAGVGTAAGGLLEFVGLANPVSLAIAASVAGAIAMDAAFGKVGPTIGAATASQRRLEGAITSQVGWLQRYRGALATLPTSINQTMTAELGVKQAQMEVNRLRRTGKTNTLEYRQAVVTLRGAQEQARQAQDAYNKNLQDGLRPLQQHEGAMQAHRNELDKLRKSMKPGSEDFKRYTHDITLMDRAILDTKNDESGFLLNSQRQMRGMLPLAESARRSIGGFARSFAAVPNAKRIILTTNAPQKVAEVANLGGRLDRLGDHKYTARILANSKNADEAIARMRRRLEIVSGTRAVAKLLVNDRDASAKISAVTHSIARIPDRKARLQAMNQATPMIAHVVKRLLGVDDRTARLIAKNMVHDGVAAARNELAKIPRTKTITVQAVFQDYTRGKIPRFGTPGHPGKSGASGAVVANASGGTGRPRSSTIERAAQTAARRPVQKTNGQKVRQPTMLVGEERREEIVLATNPRYRQRNLGLLAYAARKLDADPSTLAGGGRGKRRKTAKTPTIMDEINSWNALPDRQRMKAARQRARWTGHGWVGKWPGKSHGSIMYEDASIVPPHRARLQFQKHGQYRQGNPFSNNPYYSRTKGYGRNHAEGGIVPLAAGGTIDMYESIAAAPGQNSVSKGEKPPPMPAVGPVGGPFTAKGPFAKSNAPRANREKAIQAGNAWERHVDVLQSGERFASANLQRAEGRMQQPDSMIVESKVTAADGSIQSVYTVDDAAVAAYRAQVLDVVQWQDTLLGWLKEESIRIPVAMRVMDAQMAAGKAGSEDAVAQMSYINKALRAANKVRKKNAKIRRAITEYNNQKKHWEGYKTRMDDASSEGRDLKNTFGGRNAEVFQEFEDVRQERNDTATLYNEIPGLAAGEAADAAAGAAAGGGSGSGDNGAGQILADRNAALTEHIRLSDAATAAALSPGDVGAGGYQNAISAARDYAGTGTYGSDAMSRLSSNAQSRTVASQPAGGGALVGTGATAGGGAPAGATGGFAGGAPVVGGAGGGGVTLVQNINTLHPGDPATLSAIGSAATAGIDLQANVQPTRVATGL